MDFEKYTRAVAMAHLSRDRGRVTEVSGLLIKGTLPGASLGSLVEIHPLGIEKVIQAEVVGFKDKHVLMMSLGDNLGLGLGAPIKLKKSSASIRVSNQMLGRVLDPFSQPIDDGPPIERTEELQIYNSVRGPLERRPIREALDLGVRCLNSCLTLGQGQRVSIMAGSGVGKSVLLGMLARYSKADVNVIALIGERGREVKEFIENDLGERGLKKSVVICVTSDRSALLRMRGAFVATAIAEYFSKQGKNVLLMMDSVTRFSMAMREIGLSVGEPPSSKGYPPSVFAALPRLLERAGSFENEGSITGIYTTLVEGDDMNDPIGDAVRSIVDGHIVLSRTLGQKGHYPAIDILQSSSRVMRNVVSVEHLKLAQKLRENLAVYKEAEDLINIGAYKAGSNPRIDKSVRLIEPINQFLRQDLEEPSSMTETIRGLQQILVNS